MIPEPAEEAEPLHRATDFERCADFYGVPAAARSAIQRSAWRVEILTDVPVATELPADTNLD